MKGHFWVLIDQDHWLGIRQLIGVDGTTTYFEMIKLLTSIFLRDLTKHKKYEKNPF